MIQIAVHGATGRLGSLIMKEGNDCCHPLNRGEYPSNIDVVIDVSSAEGTRELLKRLNGEALLVGTTGDLPLAELEEYAQTAPVAIVSNFSVGIPLLLELVKQALTIIPEGWDIEIVETHHNQKKDAPSGTAKRLLRCIEEEGYTDIPCHALRMGDLFGEHSVYLAGPGEKIELKHTATRREVFAIGALRWAKWLSTQQNALFQP